MCAALKRAEALQEEAGDVRESASIISKSARKNFVYTNFLILDIFSVFGKVAADSNC